MRACTGFLIHQTYTKIPFFHSMQRTEKGGFFFTIKNSSLSFLTESEPCQVLALPTKILHCKSLWYREQYPWKTQKIKRKQKRYCNITAYFHSRSKSLRSLAACKYDTGTVSCFYCSLLVLCMLIGTIYTKTGGTDGPIDYGLPLHGYFAAHC